MSPILTFTANLLAETTYGVPPWTPGQTRRAAEEIFQVGGKGINVSKMLLRLQGETKAICFPGGAFGGPCRQWLEERNIPLEAPNQGCVTRSGSVIRSDNQPETTFLGADSIVSASAVEQVVNYLSTIEQRFVLAICGSIQNWEETCWDPLRTWIENREQNAILAVDTYGPSLSWMVQQKPDCIKINRDELSLLFGKSTASTPELLASASKQYPCPLWIITNGAEEVWVQQDDHNPTAFHPPATERVSPTGCGDVFFATLLNGLYQKEETDLTQIIRRCVEYSARNAASPRIAEFEL